MKALSIHSLVPRFTEINSAKHYMKAPGGRKQFWLSVYGLAAEEPAAN